MMSNRNGGDVRAVNVLPAAFNVLLAEAVGATVVVAATVVALRLDLAVALKSFRPCHPWL